MAARISLGLVVAGAIAVGVAWGLGALWVYVALAVIAGAISFAAGVGGDWLTGASRGRFERKPRRRS
jgi:hypothetical protein